MSELFCVVGPTASGKTELAVRLAEQLDGEIVSADSVQVYRHFEIGTGKPSLEQRARAAHHLIDIREPLDTLDAASWAALADASIQAIRSRGKLPIVCGGTFLWVKSLLFGLVPTPPADPQIRARHRKWVESNGRAALRDRLREVDPVAAERLAPNDFVRVSRALEVYELTGVPLSQLHAEHGFKAPRHRARLLGVRRERSEMDALIARRAEAMLAAGWEQEVRELDARGYGASRAMQSVGYKQVFEHAVVGSTGGKTLVEAIVQATRIFARRQRTWLRDQPIEWVAPDFRA